MANAGHSGRKWRELRATVLANSTTCWLCAHHSADSVDYVIPWSLGGPMTLTNLRPAHCQPCPVCGIRCNQAKGQKPATNPTSRQW